MAVRACTQANPDAITNVLVVLHILMPVLAVATLGAACNLVSGVQLNWAGLVVAAGGTLTVYAGDRWLDPTGAQRRLPRWILLAFVFLGVLAGVLGVVRDWQLLLPASVAAVLSLVYVWVRRLSGLRIGVIAASWLVAICWLPLGPGAWFPADLSWGVITAVWLVVAAGTLVCDIKDIEHDRLARQGSLAGRLGLRRSRWVATGGVAIAATIAVIWGDWWFAAWFGVALIAHWPALPQRPLAGPLAVDATLALPGVGIAIMALTRG